MFNICGLKKYSWIFLTIGICISSCSDVIEENLDGKSVVVISPTDSLETSDSSIQFDWEQLDEAASYRFQVARPNFPEIEELVFDSIITNNSLTLSLLPGSYQWRIRPENSSSYGNYITRTLSIDSTLDLTGQEIILQFPQTNFITNQSSIEFLWYDLYNAEQYSFLLKNDDWSGSLLLPEVITQENEVVIEDIPEGQFSWGVRGESTLSNTVYSVFSFTTDYTDPGVPTLVAPANTSNVISPVLFSWNRASDFGTQLSDSLYIYSDLALQNIVYSSSETTTSHTEELTSGVYYWRVKTFDVAGNIGSFSTTRTVTVQ